MIKHYETIFILTPVLSQVQVEETTKKIQDFLKEENSIIDHHESWGIKKLSYPIEKKESGYYELIQFHINKEIEFNNTINKLETLFKRDERILRFLSIKLNKEALIYSDNRRNKISLIKKKI